MLKKLIKEPLLHFLLLGGLIFAFSGGEDAAPAPAANRIVVSADRVNGMRESFADYWRRPPTEEELDQLVDDYVTEEVLYREARLIGLDKEDPIIRARLAHEMGMLAETDLAPLEPEEETLRAYMAEHEEDYRRGDSCSIRQLYFGAADDPESTARAEAARAVLVAADEEFKWKNLGEAIGLPTILERLRWKEVAGLFGDVFQARIADAPAAQWRGPIDSKYGVHLVYILEREAGAIPDFEDVRAIVERDWETAVHLEKRDAYFDELRGKYAIRIEESAPGAARAPVDGE